MTETTVKTNYKKKYSTHLPKEDYQLYQRWQKAKMEPRQFFNRKQLEKELRHKGYGYLVGDLPKKNEVSKKEYEMILKYRKLRMLKDFDSAKLVRRNLRQIGLGAFTGDVATLAKPPLKERIMTAENIIAFTNAINAPILGFLDTEFTTRRHEILSLGCVAYDTTTQKTYYFYQTTKPVYEKHLSTRCKDLTHLTQKEIDTSPSFTQVVTDFKAFMDKHHIQYLMTWGSSDYTSMKISFSYSHLSLKLRDDVLSTIVDIQPLISLLRDETRSQFSLQDMKEYYHLEGAVEHHALQDAKDLKDIILAFKKKYPSDT